jgi:hypothetical protein
MRVRWTADAADDLERIAPGRILQRNVGNVTLGG